MTIKQIEKTDDYRAVRGSSTMTCAFCGEPYGTRLLRHSTMNKQLVHKKCVDAYDNEMLAEMEAKKKKRQKERRDIIRNAQRERAELRDVLAMANFKTDVNEKQLVAEGLTEKQYNQFCYVLNTEFRNQHMTHKKVADYTSSLLEHQDIRNIAYAWKWGNGLIDDICQGVVAENVLQMAKEGLAAIEILDALTDTLLSSASFQSTSTSELSNMHDRAMIQALAKATEEFRRIFRTRDDI